MRILAGVVAFLLIPIGTVGAQQPAPALKIVVLEGEGGVNIIQQKTAVRPLIEVRDRNNVPVSGASVTFTIGGGGQSAAFAGGAQTLTVNTNAAGQAAASGLIAVGSGAFQIQVQAAYQGLVASATISLTNFATAAAAAAAGAAASGGTVSGAAAGAAGAGGGLSATTIGIVGAAVAGGAVAATQVAGKTTQVAGKKVEDERTGFDPYTGSFSGQVVILVSYTTPEGVPGSCTRTRAMTGTMTIDLNVGGATGTVRMNSVQNEIAVTGTCILVSGPMNLTIPGEPVAGGPSNLTFTHTATFGAAETDVLTFKGSQAGATITATIAFNITGSVGVGSVTMPVTLTRQP